MKKAKAGSDESPQVQLRVAEAKHRDVGKCRARLDPHYMEQIGVQPGEVIEIIGKRATAVTAWPADDEEQETDIIRIDGQTRKNASVGLNDLLNVRKAESKAAKSITLMPIGDSNITVDKEFCEFVKGRLKGFPVSEGDEISVVILGNSMDFKVQKVSPKAIVRVERPTKLVIMAETAQDRKPRVTYEEIGGMKEQIKRLREIVELPMRHPEVFARLGIEPHSGILMYGPPGTGKTLIAKALATESNANIIIVRGPEVLSKWVGESEKAIREIFRKAKTSSPCIVVFDELDSLARPRGQSEDGAGNERVVSQILTEMDDAGNSGVIIVGITNRPDLIDPSLLRPGRLDLIVYIGQPDEKARFEILKIITQPMPLENDVDLASIAQTTRNFSGADLFALCREAAVSAMQRKSPTISNADFAQALRAARPSITKEVEEWYESMKKSLTYAMPKPIDKSFYG